MTTTSDSDHCARLLRLVSDYQQLAEGQAEELAALKIENARLQALLIDEVKCLALYVRRGVGTEVTVSAPAVVKTPVPVAQLTASTAPQTLPRRNCRKCGNEFQPTKKLGRVCSDCLAEIYRRRGQHLHTPKLVAAVGSYP